MVGINHLVAINIQVLTDRMLRPLALRDLVA